MKKTTFWALVGTGIWLGIILLAGLLNWDEFKKMPPNEWGDFLAGTLSPLALFWLVAGYLQQGRELKLNTEALLLQQEELAAQVKATLELKQESARQAGASEELARLTQIQHGQIANQRKEERVRAIKPDIHVRYHSGSDDSQIRLDVSNWGGDAFRLRASSPAFTSPSFDGDRARLNRAQAAIRLLLSNPTNAHLDPADSYLMIFVEDIDAGHWEFHFSRENFVFHIIDTKYSPV